MSLQNRVDPFGELIATSARGLFLGNRGGRFHRDDQTLGKRRWSSRQWICCVLQFKGRHHPVWRDRYTALFFLDEPTAFAAGHRPCFECRRVDAAAFAQKWAQAKGGAVPRAPAMDLVLQAERLNGRAKRTHERAFADLPDGAFVVLSDAGYAVRSSHLLRWNDAGYTDRITRPRGMATVLTPPSIVDILSAGYQPHWHPTAG